MKVIHLNTKYTWLYHFIVNSFPRANDSTIIWLDDVDCAIQHSRLLSCQHGGFGNHDCDHSQDVAVICRSARGTPPTSGVTIGTDDDDEEFPATNSEGAATQTNHYLYCLVIVGFFVVI